MPTLSEQLSTAIAQVIVDSGLLNDIVHGPASGEGSTVETDGGTVKTLAKAIAEVGDTSLQAVKDLSNVLDADFAAKAASAVTPADIDAAADSHTHLLSDITDAGTAAALDAGTSAGNVVALDGSARLPAVDGSLVTGIVDNVARNIAASSLAYLLAQNDATSIVGAVGPLYLVDDFEADSLNVSTNATYDAAGDYYHNAGSFTADQVPTMTGYSAPSGTVATSNDSNSAAWKAFSDADEDSNAWNTDGVHPAWISYDWGSGNGKTIRRYSLKVSASFPDRAPKTWTFEGWDGSGWVVLDTQTNVAAWTGSETRTYDIPNLTSYESYRLNVSARQGGTTLIIEEISMMERNAAASMTLRPSAAALAAADPNDAAGWFLFDPQEVVTFGTDIVGKVSIDGGSAWATGSWGLVGDLGSLGEVWRLDADVSAQTGSSLLYEITTPTSKEVRFVECIGILPIA